MSSRAGQPGSRICAIASHVPACRTAADIGCDHGWLGAVLLGERPGMQLIAADVSRPSLKKAARRLAPFGDRVQIRLGDGLSVLQPGEAEVIVASGMGGRTIDRIVRAGLAQARAASALLLSPHASAGELRRSLAELDFRIEDEWILEEDGHFYPLLRAAAGGGQTESDPFWYEFSRVALGREDEMSRRYVRHMMGVTERALMSVGEADEVRCLFLRRRLARLRSFLPRGPVRK
ncbi:MAG: SAM-dependent methyltransferase [Clostridia bacterium]|nr:SAM-dependent methyltransferase [Clostridia bacterium]